MIMPPVACSIVLFYCRIKYPSPRFVSMFYIIILYNTTIRLLYLYYRYMLGKTQDGNWKFDPLPLFSCSSFPLLKNHVPHDLILL